MKNYLILLISLFTLALTGCDSKPKVRFSPYSLQNYDNLRTDERGIKSVRDSSIIRDAYYGTYNTTVSEFTIDEAGRVSSGNFNADSDTNEWTISYDAAGRVTGVSDKYDYHATYNEEGDLVAERYYFANDSIYGVPQSGMDYEYDDHGYLTSALIVDSEGVIQEHVYDFDGKLFSTVEYGMEEQFETTYNYRGLPDTCETYDTSSDSKKLVSTTTYEYDYDDYGNWIHRTEYVKEKGKKKRRKASETFRTLTYYSGPYTSAAALAASEPAKTASSGNFISNYFSDLSWRLTRAGYMSGASSVMLLVLLIITIAVAVGGMYWIIKADKFPGFSGARDENGMKRLWMYNWQPYASVGLIMADILAAFFVAILSMLIVGCVVWLFFGVIKLLMMALVVVGYILLIVGILGVLAKEGFGCLGVLIGGAIVAAEDWFQRTGDQLLQWGTDFMNEVNLISFGYHFFTNFWDVILAVILTPIVIFLAIAALFIILSMILTGVEWIITKIYSIRRPCPECSNTGNFEYMINGRPHPVALRPGLYGVFHQTRYVPYNTNMQYRVPTMLLNGRGRLDRRCSSCGAMISATGQHALGTDVHIGFVGHVGAGKSYLIYGGLGELMKQYPDRMEQINSGDNSQLDIATRSRQIAMSQSFKTDKSRAYRAIELMIEVSGRPVPYHVHFYDVAGEQFVGSSATSASDTAAMKFYSSVKSIVVVIDPLQLDLTAPGVTPSPQFENWQNEHNRSSKRYNIADIFSSLQGYLDHYGRSGSLKDIDVSIVVVKSDLGFFQALNYPKVPSDGDVESFINNELGLGSLLNTARAYRSVSFYATSAVSDDKSALSEFFKKMLRQRGINF